MNFWHLVFLTPIIRQVGGSISGFVQAPLHRFENTKEAAQKMRAVRDAANAFIASGGINWSRLASASPSACGTDALA